MSNPKRPVSTVEEFIKVFHEMSARYGHSELWYDYIDIRNRLRHPRFFLLATLCESGIIGTVR